MKFTEKTITSRVVYTGRIITVKEDTAELINGKEVYRGWWTIRATLR